MVVLVVCEKSAGWSVCFMLCNGFVDVDYVDDVDDEGKKQRKKKGFLQKKGIESWWMNEWMIQLLKVVEKVTFPISKSKRESI